MARSSKASLCAIALTLGGLSLPSASNGADRVTVASAKAAERASKALGKRETDKAIVAAEQAVALSPRVPQYRLLLGQSYLQAGRFQSAAQAFGDTLLLDGGNGRAALNLALTQIARGDRQAARATLDAHIGDVPTADRGLALALAGDTTGAVALLTLVARSPDTSPKVRQNLALAYALAGEWNIARVVAAADMSPSDVDARLEQWAAFVQPRGASDQVASLLGVRPVADSGQPVALALVTDPTPAAVARVDVAPVPVEVPPPPVVASIASSNVVGPRIVFGPTREVVQPLTDRLLRREIASYKQPVRRLSVGVAAKPAGGAWFVQLGAYDNVRVAKDAWGRATQRYAAFRGRVPQGKDIRTTRATYYRLSVGGFTRAGADQACKAYRVRGGECFIRTASGDQVALWVKPAVRLAMK